MSLLEKAVAAVTRQESAQARQEARAKARAAAETGDWLAIVLDQHGMLEEAFGTVSLAEELAGRRAALNWLVLVLTGRSNAKESVIHPALVRAGHKTQPWHGYTGEAGAKVDG